MPFPPRSQWNLILWWPRDVVVTAKTRLSDVVDITNSWFRIVVTTGGSTDRSSSNTLPTWPSPRVLWRSSLPWSAHVTIRPKGFGHEFFDPGIFRRMYFLAGLRSSHVFFVHHVFYVDFLSHGVLVVTLYPIKAELRCHMSHGWSGRTDRSPPILGLVCCVP